MAFCAGFGSPEALCGESYDSERERTCADLRRRCSVRAQGRCALLVIACIIVPVVDEHWK